MMRKATKYKIFMEENLCLELFVYSILKPGLKEEF